MRSMIKALRLNILILVLIVGFNASAAINGKGVKSRFHTNELIK